MIADTSGDLSTVKLGQESFKIPITELAVASDAVPRIFLESATTTPWVLPCAEKSYVVVCTRGKMTF